MKAKTKLFAILLLPAMACAAAVVATATTQPRQAPTLGSPTHSHDGYTAWTSSNSLPSSPGSYYLDTDVTISSTWNVPGAVDLCLNGHSITKTGNTGSVIYLTGSSKTLNLYECDTTTHYYYINESDHYLGVVVDTEEAAIAGNPDRHGSFVGGWITGGRGYTVDGHYRGGCVVVDYESNLNFYGGTMIGNAPAFSDTGSSVGCMFLHFGNATMHDGAYIIGNSSIRTGGIAGNYNSSYGGIFTMDGGVVADNTSTGNGDAGGGINAGIPMTITGGKISDNLCLDTLAGGGGIAVGTAPGAVHIGGNVEISNNRTAGYGGGINIVGTDYGWMQASSALTISGNPKIFGNEAKHKGDSYVSDNLYISTKVNSYYSTGEELTLGEALGKDAMIGVTMEEGSGKIVYGWTNVMGAEAEPSDYFFSDNPDCILSSDSVGDPIIIDLSSVVATVESDAEAQYFTSFNEALSAWGDGKTLKLNKDATAQITVSEGNKTLDLNNHILSTSNASVITVSGGELHVVDSSAEKTTHYYNLSGAWNDYSGSQKGPATISDTPTDYHFEGGYITSDNTSTYPDGGGIMISGGHVVFSSGTVFGTKSGSGGIRVGPEGHLTFEGEAKVIGNYQQRDWCSTGGIDSSGRLDMTGGYVLHNSALTSVGGVRIRGESQNPGNYCRIVGGEITGNYCETDLGHGIFVDTNSGTAIQIGGTAKIHDNGKPDFASRANNIYFGSENERINVAEPFKEGANVWMSWQKVQPSAANPLVMTNNWSEVMGNEDPYYYLHHDADDAEVYLKDGQAVAGPVSYNVSFDGNSGAGTMGDVTSNLRSYALPENGFTAPEGMRFLGWKWNKDGKIYAPGAKVVLSEDTSFTAQWGPEGDDSWQNLSGVIYQNDGVTPAAGATVKVYLGNQIYNLTTADEQGNYQVDCPDGYYNLIAEYGDISMTMLVEVAGATVKNIILSSGKTESVLNVNSDVGIVVGGLDQEAESIRQGEAVSADKDVSISMNVEQKPAETAQNADKIIESAPEENLEFLEIKVEKTVDNVTTALDSTTNVIEVIVPYANVAKRNVTVYSYHDGEVLSYENSNTKADGTFSVDKEQGIVKIYTSKFSTFAIGYTPYYTVKPTITLGSYTGLVTATLENVDTHEKTILENVALDEVVFQDVTKGQYLLTITWVDGASNTLTMPVTVK